MCASNRVVLSFRHFLLMLGGGWAAVDRYVKIDPSGRRTCKNDPDAADIPLDEGLGAPTVSGEGRGVAMNADVGNAVAALQGIVSAIGDLATAIGRGNAIVGAWVLFALAALILGEPDED